MIDKIEYSFSAKIWKHEGPGGWHFVSLPNDISDEIRSTLKWQEEGWGRMKAQAVIGKTKWDCAIWFDKKHNSYLLPIKVDIRNKNHLKVGDDVLLTMYV